MQFASWSSPFSREQLQAISRVEPIEQITPEWAWGGSTGRGVKVAIIDSGIDAHHPAVGPVQGYVAISEGPDGLVYSADPHDDAYGHATADRCAAA